MYSFLPLKTSVQQREQTVAQFGLRENSRERKRNATREVNSGALKEEKKIQPSPKLFQQPSPKLSLIVLGSVPVIQLMQIQRNPLGQQGLPRAKENEISLNLRRPTGHISAPHTYTFHEKWAVRNRLLSYKCCLKGKELHDHMS